MLGVLGQPAQPEVGQLGNPLTGNEDIARIDIPVNQTNPVNRPESGQDLAK